ncbi:TetR family transcriptional regulator C-terminal domain-containing protein [Micromonospora purpureochromogenes]|nr:TetR family transcriptional regulator C-terminal domain-containing protein [Micromonospora purpureochromogenes]
MSLFGPNEAGPDPKPADDRTVRLQLLITVKAAPNPSEKYGETVCVAGLRTDVLRPTWVRLYPINFRHLDSDEAFKKYDIVSIDAKPARQDQRHEHFDSKEALAIVALERYGDGRRLEDLTDSSVPPVQRLRSHFEFLRDEVVRYEYHRGCLYGNFGTEIVDHRDAIRDAVRHSLDKWASLIATTLVEAQRAGTVRADVDPEVTAGFLVNAWEGTLIRARTDRSPAAFDAFFSVFDTLLAPV